MFSNNKPSIVSVGDSFFDTFFNIENPKISAIDDGGLKFLKIPFGDKIEIKGAVEGLGGNSANASVTFARLGLKTYFFSFFGDDDAGKKIIETLKKEKINTNYIFVKKGHTTSRATVMYLDGERTIFIWGDPHAYPKTKLPKTSWIYLSACGESADGIYDIVSELAKRTGAKIAFQPGTKQLADGPEKARKMLMMTEVMIVNKEEAMDYVQQVESEKLKVESDKVATPLLIDNLLQKLHGLGPKIAVITDGPNGAWAFDGEKNYFLKPPESVKVVEATGAGDAFASALVSALAFGKDIKTAMSWGQKNALSVIQYIGAQRGILKISQIV